MKRRTLKKLATRWLQQCRRNYVFYAGHHTRWWAQMLWRTFGVVMPNKREGQDR